MAIGKKSITRAANSQTKEIKANTSVLVPDEQVMKQVELMIEKQKKEDNDTDQKADQKADQKDDKKTDKKEMPVYLL